MASRTSKVMSLSIAQGILMIVGIISSMVFARTLSVSDYGTYLQTFLAYDFAVPVLTLGLPSALFYFLPGEFKRQKGLVLDNMLLLFLAALIFSFFLFFGGTELLSRRFNNPNLTKTLNWMVLYPLYTFPLLLASAVWVVKDKVKLNAIYNAVTGLILTVSLIVSALLTESYEAPTLVKISIPILFLPFALFLIFKNVPGRWESPKLSSMWNMVKFAVPLGLASVFGTLAIQLASLMVSLLTTPAEYAIYANGAKEVPFIGIVTGSISVVIMAEMAHKIKEGDLKSALELFRKAATISASFLLPIMTFLLIFADSFIEILYSNKYEASVIPFRIYLFVIPIRIVYYGSALIALGRTKVILYRSIIDLCLTTLFSYLFVLWLGASGAALGLVLTMFLWTVPYNLNILGKEFNCKPTYILPLRKVGLILLISIIAGIGSSFIFMLNLKSLLTFIIGILIFSILYLSMAVGYIPEFKNQINFYFKKILK